MLLKIVKIDSEDELYDCKDFIKGTIELKAVDKSKRSSCRQALYDRTFYDKPHPLPTLTSAVRVAVGTISTTLEFMSLSVPFAQGLASGRKANLPPLSNTKIEKVRINRVDCIEMMGILHFNHHHALMNAEWIYNSITDKCISKVCLYMHGGAYSIASRRTHRQITSRIAKYVDCKVLSIDYRLSPQHVFPGPLIDAISAYKYILSLGYNPENIAFAGDSSGGGLATSLMLYCRDSGGTLPMPACLAVMSPFYDMTQSLPSWHLNAKYCYLPKDIKDKRFQTPTRTLPYVGIDMDALHPYASPIFASSSEIKICPTLIQVGDAERIRDDGLYFASQSMNSDESIFTEVYEDGVHVFQLFSIFDSFANHALERLSAFIKNHMGSRGILVDSRAIKVFNGKSYPVERISDLNGILNDGVEFLVDQKVYIPNASKPLM